MTDQQKEAGLEEARQVLRAARTAALSVLDFETAGPLGGLVNVAFDPQFQPIILTSTLSRHTQCMDRDGRASLMVTGDLPTSGDALTGFRATVTGVFTRSAGPEIKDCFLAQHPYAKLYAGFGDFGFWLMVPARLYVVAGFGRVYTYAAAELTETT
jgi:heme iron utilization protein